MPRGSLSKSPPPKVGTKLLIRWWFILYAWKWRVQWSPSFLYDNLCLATVLFKKHYRKTCLNLVGTKSSRLFRHDLSLLCRNKILRHVRNISLVSNNSCSNTVASCVQDHVSPASLFVCLHSWGIFVYTLQSGLNNFNVVVSQVLSSWLKSWVTRHLNGKTRR